MAAQTVALAANRKTVAIVAAAAIAISGLLAAGSASVQDLFTANLAGSGAQALEPITTGGTLADYLTTDAALPAGDVHGAGSLLGAVEDSLGAAASPSNGVITGANASPGIMTGASNDAPVGTLSTDVSTALGTAAFSSSQSAATISLVLD